MNKYCMTAEQIDKANEKMENGFALDLRSLLYHKLKEPCKQIAVDDTHYYEFKLCYMEDKIDRYTYSGLKKPMLHISLWRDMGNGMAQTNGIGCWVQVGEPVKRGTLAMLTKLTKQFDTETLYRMAENNIQQLKKSTVL